MILSLWGSPNSFTGESEGKQVERQEGGAGPWGHDKGPSVTPSVTVLEKWRNTTVHARAHEGPREAPECFKKD